MLTRLRDSEVVPKRVRTDISLNSRHQAKRVIAVRGMSDAPKRGLSGQHLMGKSEFTFQVVLKFIICPG